MSITIEVLDDIEPTLRWKPKAGPFTAEFISRKAKEFGCSEGDLEPVLLEAHTILGRCVPPSDPAGSATGLVVGYVQSGKTLSFTTVTALARDNGYGLVILLAGTQVNLKDQSERRLARDLGLEAELARPWIHVDNPTVAASLLTLKSALTTWKSPETPEGRRRAVLVTVLKNSKRLDDLMRALVAVKTELAGVPVLVIDDEGDQAGLNNYAAQNRASGQDRASPVYSKVVALKSTLPHHTFVQYTATPQANLLLGLADVLSPSFAETVSPGEGYVGGKTLFGKGSPYAQTIPARDIPSAQNQLAAAPASLLRALRLYLLGACAFAATADAGVRSMMIHPSMETSPHADYLQWVSDAVNTWKTLIALPDGALPRDELRQDFLDVYRDLVQTVTPLEPFDALFQQLSFVLKATVIREVNSASKGGKAKVKWADSDFWILVGGNKLDRGFTVEGLTVTYMPRPIGTGNADTLQQRARFFGYKKKYLGFCRIFLLADVKEAFEAYVEHEEFVRDALNKHRGRPLGSWKRDFILDTRLNPTRPGVIGLDTEHIRVAEWCHPQRPYAGIEAVKGNQEAMKAFVDLLRSRFTEHRAADIHKFRDRREGGRDRNRLFESVPLTLVIDELLLRLRVADVEDSVAHYALVLALNHLAAKSESEHKESLVCSVFLIDNLVEQGRSLDSRGRGINQPFSGKSPNTTDESKLNYVGDRALVDDGHITVHLRTFKMLDDPGPDTERSKVPWYGVLVPSDLAKGVVVELP